MANENVAFDALGSLEESRGQDATVLIFTSNNYWLYYYTDIPDPYIEVSGAQWSEERQEELVERAEGKNIEEMVEIVIEEMKKG